MKINEQFLTKYYTQGTDNRLQAQANYYYSHKNLLDEINRKREINKLKEEITEEVLSRVSIRIDDEALKQLRDLLNGLFQ